MTLDVFLLILRLLFIVLLYLFLMQVVIAILRDLRKTAANNADGFTGKAAPVVGHLIVVDSGPSSILPGTRFNLLPQTTIGRGPTCDIQLTDNFISGEHTRMWYRNGTWYVQDAGSTNGTYLNNQPAREPLPARFGDIVQVGFIRFKLAQ
ncbi:MAG TPA: FHA domain-containing protein [Ktedonobacteraceae bacterium]|jgi:pSer/pThr/pTyr-binding forkhead associated (FHA) protein|nr:FHA domain-containing protein [Ktedonobacteraceae bacterium]